MEQAAAQRQLLQGLHWEAKVCNLGMHWEGRHMSLLCVGFGLQENHRRRMTAAMGESEDGIFWGGLCGVCGDGCQWQQSHRQRSVALLVCNVDDS